MAVKESPGSERRQDCYRTEHGGSATLWIATAERDWLFNYSHLLHVEWDPSDALTIHFSTHEVKITGLDLKPIVEALSRLSLAQVNSKLQNNVQKKEGPLIYSVVVNKLEV